MKGGKTMKASLFLLRDPRWLLGHFLGKLFYQERVDKDGNIVLPKKFFRNLNQKLMENGYSPPYIMTREECHSFWNRITNDEKFVGNRPDEYAAKSRGIIEFLPKFQTLYTPPPAHP